MNSDATQSRQRSRQDGAAGSGALQTCSGKRRSLELECGRVPSRALGQGPETRHVEQGAMAKRVAIATTGFAVIGLVTFLGRLPPAVFPPLQHNPCSNSQSLGAS